MKNKFYMQKHVRILSLLTIFFQISLIYSGFEPAQYDAGKARVFQVMYQGPGGIEDANRKTLFSETKNLTFDLNLSEISTRFGCKTLMGQGFIMQTLSKPVSPLDKNNTIKNRRNLIQLLINHPELQEKFEVLIQQAVEYESVIMKFMQGRFVMNSSDDPITFLQNLYGRSILAQGLNLWFSGVTVSKGLVGGPTYLWDSAVENYNQGVVIKDHITSVLNDKNITNPEAAKSLLAWSVMGSGIFMKDVILSTLGIGDAADNAVTRSLRVWQFALASKGLYDHYIKALSIRESLYAINRLIDISQQIETVCREYDIDHQFKLSSIRSQQGKKLLEGLQQDRYQEKDSKLFITPLVHTFIYDVYENDINLAPVYASIAEMDAYLAIAKKMTELQDTNHTFSFVQFLDDAKPKINAQGFWNVLVSKGNVVTNNISENRNIILTGANEGGKTTAIRAILQNIVLAQTFGIAAASEFALTQFDVIHSYLNVSDDILNGKSRFASELKQAQDILNRIKILKPTDKFFFAFDELFTGTNGEDGAECAYRFIDNVASYKGIQFIYATHFNKLKTIGTRNPACANYKIEPPLRDEKGQFIRDNEGQLVYPYKLSPGANNVNVAMDRAKDAGIFE